ncbi:hypothetical protein [Teredinibacter waterburyi]|uniref:hypothetical protein n=1 Tax=Teredinibacter waterburyi TaxID=1500538 RepID=UPI00165EE529|nr:hypothetical protein [Teredinibacter waterburyi]
MPKLIKLNDIHRSLLIENQEPLFIDVAFMDSGAQVTIRGEKLGVRGSYVWRGAEGLRYLHELTSEDQNTELEKLALHLIHGEDLLRGKRSTTPQT